MPLVSGVCRQASAPMLSHGGSRLNASKPEANPKTRYPQQHKHLNTPSSAVVCPGFVHTQPANCESLLCCGYSKGTSCGDDKPNRHSDFLTVVALLFREILTTCFSIESPHKPLLHAQPRWRQVSHIITRILLITTFACCPVCNTPTRDLHLCCDSTSPDLHPKAAKANTTFSNPNVPLQTRGHALAGISGMLRSLAGAQGAFTSRGAKPKGLYLMLLGLTTINNKYYYCYNSYCSFDASLTSIYVSICIYISTTIISCMCVCGYIIHMYTCVCVVICRRRHVFATSFVPTIMTIMMISVPFVVKFIVAVRRAVYRAPRLVRFLGTTSSLRRVARVCVPVCARVLACVTSSVRGGLLLAHVAPPYWRHTPSLVICLGTRLVSPCPCARACALAGPGSLRLRARARSRRTRRQPCVAAGRLP